jgi:hypothetical protein
LIDDGTDLSFDLGARIQPLICVADLFWLKRPQANCARRFMCMHARMEYNFSGPHHELLRMGNRRRGGKPRLNYVSI